MAVDRLRFQGEAAHTCKYSGDSEPLQFRRQPLINTEIVAAKGGCCSPPLRRRTTSPVEHDDIVSINRHVDGGQGPLDADALAGREDRLTAVPGQIDDALEIFAEEVVPRAGIEPATRGFSMRVWTTQALDKKRKNCPSQILWLICVYYYEKSPSSVTY